MLITLPTKLQNKIFMDNIKLYCILLLVALLNSRTILANNNEASGNNIISIEKGTKKVKLNIPSAKKIAKDLRGNRFNETCKDGYFSKQTWEIADVDDINVSIVNVKKKKNTLIYKVKIEQTLPSRGCYILDGEVCYVLHKNKWVQDYFVCERIMPKITNRYKKLISTKLNGGRGERSLEITNNSNTTLAVLGYVMYEYSGKRVRFATSVQPNDAITIGGIFVGSIAEYQIHYVELR